ncbi:MAG: RecQ family ATP-dependent DNA helicase [Planctomycetes bacterium]|nr:RecQ family ATP-dependent DNA helicase [Planctomycetota bacterium]
MATTEHNTANNTATCDDAACDIDDCLGRFSLSEFRPGQRQVIETIMSGRDCLCVMPTGAGKSLCYQLPAIALGGLTLVVSPLIALMKDQVDQLQAQGIRASLINSTLGGDEQQRRLQQMVAGEFELMYVVPERFRSPRFIEAIESCPLKLLAIDEAHCVSEWGHDFRPDYARLGQYRRKLGNPPTIALTATATATVRADIVKLLGLNVPEIFVTGFTRDNLHLQVSRPRRSSDKDDELIAFLDENPGTGIVYASSRKRCEDVAKTICSRSGRRAEPYHAGMMNDDRRAAQDRFMSGQSEIVVATNAFGMGIDKANVRFVVHYNMPGNLESYYQEAGRAGRDGLPSQCRLFYTSNDRYIHEFFIESAYPQREIVLQVYEYLIDQNQDPIRRTQQQIKEELGLPVGSEGVGACEKLLEKARALDRHDRGANTAAVRLDEMPPGVGASSLVDLLPKQAKVKRRVLQAIERLVGERRGELVDFRPPELAEAADIDITSLAHVLRELSQLPSLEYLPPFRGRAITVRRPAVAFEALDIDFETLKKHRDAEYEKLEQMIGLCTSRQCRQLTILRYFGDTNGGECGNCDNCDANGRKSTPKMAATQVDEAIRRAVLMVLSGVARAQQLAGDGIAGFGKNAIAKMLTGSTAVQMERTRLNRLSTYGLMKHLQQTEAVELIDALMTAGHIDSVDYEKFRPIIQLTELGETTMRGEQPIESLPLSAGLFEKLRRGAAPASAAPNETSADAAQPVDVASGDSLPETLRNWRRDTAQQENVPAYCVIHNATIDELSKHRPRTRAELLEINRIGPAKCDRYGEALLRIIAEVSTAPLNVPTTEPAETPDLSEPLDSPPAVELSREPPPKRSSHFWTWRMIEAGFGIEEIQQARVLTREAVLLHLLRAVSDGLGVDVVRLYSPGELESLRKVASRVQSDSDISPDALPAGLDPLDVELFSAVVGG